MPPPGMRPEAFRKKVNQLIENGEPVMVHVGCGRVILKGFLNVQLRPFPTHHKNNFYRFDASEPWPCPDECVDFVFHEDFLEHLDQRGQFRFLAETLRVMKPGATQYVSIPSIDWVMRTRSNFRKGAEGVYEEWRRMKHHLLHSHESLRDMTQLVGFEYEPTGRHPLAVRPDPTGPAKRDAKLGNVIALLTKPENT